MEITAINKILKILEIAGILTFAVSGMLYAKKRNMDDLIGIYAVALVCAFGGGTLRDLFLDRHPLFWISNHHYLIVILILSLATMFIKVDNIPKWINETITISDALGTGLFTIVGVEISLQNNLALMTAAILGVITGTCGGVLRDIIGNETPYLFQKTEFCATCCFLGCIIYMSLRAVEFPSTINMIISTLSIAIFRYISVKKNLKWSHLITPR